jgi:hypothetical protein
MPEVAICIENVVISALGIGIWFKCEWQKYLPEDFVQPLSVCLPLLTQSLLGNIVVLDLNWQESDHYDVVC